MIYTNHLLTTKTFFGLKGDLKNLFIVLALSILICCSTVSYQQIATDSPYDLISLEDSLINDGLSKKNQTALALAHKNIGLIQMEKGDYINARGHFLNALNYSYDDSIAQYNLFMINGHLLKKTGNKEKLWEAIETYYKALKLDQTNGEPYFFIGQCYQSLGNKDFDLILESYQKALSLQLSGDLKLKVESEILLVSDREKKLKDFWK